jgi:short subunit dehydrogenase-like uncharacterized protein
MNGRGSWIIYGAAGFTGTLITERAHGRGHRPVLAGRSAQPLTDLADRLDLPWRAMTLDDPAALSESLADVDLVLNVAGPFVHTAAPLVEACLSAGVHYLDISNELQVFRTLYDLDERGRQEGISIIPGVGFGVVATNCLARHVSEAVGGADHLEVGSRPATIRPGPGAEATLRENLPYGGWTRRTGQLHPYPLGSGATAITFPDGPCRMMPLPTGDLEAAFQATGAANIVAYSAVPGPSAVDQVLADAGTDRKPTDRSFGWARATGRDGTTAQSWLETGDSYGFTAEASLSAVEATLALSQAGAFSPAMAFGAEFALSLQDTIQH